MIIKNHRKDSLNWRVTSYYLLVVCNVRYILLLCSLSRNLLKDLFQEYYECPVQDSRFFIYIVHARDLFLFFYLFQRVRYITNVNDRPFHGFFHFLMDKLRKIRRLLWKDRL